MLDIPPFRLSFNKLRQIFFYYFRRKGFFNKIMDPHFFTFDKSFLLPYAVMSILKPVTLVYNIISIRYTLNKF